MAMPDASSASLTKEDFIAVAAPALERLRRRYPNPKEDLHVSDVVDAEGNQYVNLVQEGGGVLGIALLGYTYILEMMGIRFMKMAGTSAGAINTMMLTALGEKHEMKSLRILELLSAKPLFDFVDGSALARRLIKTIVSNQGIFKRLKRWAIVTLVAWFGSLLILLFALGRWRFDFVFWAPLIFFVAASSVLLWAWMWFQRRKREFYNAQFGINPGNNFYEWVSEILRENNIRTLSDLRRHVERTPPGGFRLKRQQNPEDLSDLNNPKLENFLVLVTSDITNQLKVEFPRMWRMYWKDEESVNPAGFVRASMAVPVFFRPYSSPRPPAEEEALESFTELAGLDEADRLNPHAHFIDGGMISNFPINVFYNPRVQEPRLPTFGIMLNDEAPSQKSGKEGYSSFWEFAGAMFSTLRYHYDREFLIKHADFKKTIGEIDVSGINWLNFNLSHQDKLELFRRGAEAAARFLLGPSADEHAPASPQAPASDDDAFESVGRGVGAHKAAEAAPQGGFNWNSYKQYRRNRKRELGI